MSTETEAKATEKEATLAELRKKVAELEQQVNAKTEEIDKLKEKEEGWLVWTPNPVYDGLTAGITFTDGMAFVAKGRVIPRFVVEMPGDEQLEKLDNKTKESLKKQTQVPSSERAVRYIVNEFGYNAEYFTKEQMDELQKRISARAKERAEVQSKMGSREDMLEKLIVAHRM